MLLISFLLIIIYLCTYIKKDKVKLYCTATTLWISVSYFGNEILSQYNRLDEEHLILVYLGIDVLLVIFILSKLANKNTIEMKEWYKYNLNLKRDYKIITIFLVLLLLIFGLMNYTIPYNWDSMTYHLPRITEWVQNKSIAHYATYDVRRVTSPVLPAFINLQIYLFHRGNDSVFNFLQYTSFVTNAILVYQISKKMKVKKEYCWLSMLLFISMPIAFGEALSTQVDHFSTLWLLMFVYLLLDVLRDDYRLEWNKRVILDVILLSSCIAYGYLAKPSVMFGMVFFAVWLLGVSIRRKDPIKDIILLIFISVLIIGIIIAPEVIRNIITFGSISDPIAGKRQLIGTINPLYVLVNGLMNYTMNLPNIFLDWRGFLEHCVYWIAYILKVDIRSPLIAEDGVAFYLHEAGRYNHDTAINPTVVIVSTIVLIGVIWKLIKREKLKFQYTYIIVSVGAFLFFCCVVKWEPFVTRYMLSYLALLCPVAGIWLSEMKKQKYSSAILGILIFISVYELIGLFSYHYSISREQNKYEERTMGYFTVNGANGNNYVTLKQELEKIECSNIGLYLSMAATYEYPIWTMVDEDVRMESILVDNATARYENQEFIPEYIIVINKDANDIRNYKMQEYTCYKEIDTNFSIWELEK